jgi:hypothetical protein
MAIQRNLKMKINIGQFPKGSGRRKIKIEIEKFDTYSLDHTLALIIYPALLQLKATKHGVPNDFAMVGGEDYLDQSCFDFYSDDQNEMFNQRCQAWDDALDKMIWSFQQLADDNHDSKYHHGTAEYDWVQTDKLYPNPISGKMEPTYQMVDKNPGEHWYDSVGHQLHEERIQEGIMLFAKYYRNLWD